jgi:hypothetical protein
VFSDPECLRIASILTYFIKLTGQVAKVWIPLKRLVFALPGTERGFYRTIREADETKNRGMRFAISRCSRRNPGVRQGDIRLEEVLSIEWKNRDANGAAGPLQRRRSPGVLAVLSGLLLGLVLGGSAWADPIENQPIRPVDGPRLVFSSIEIAWAEGDAEVLASLVQMDGIRVAMGGAAERIAEYSPNQSLYFFKNLFQTRDTHEFSFTRMQDARAGERAHGMATWRYGESGASVERELRLVFLLTRQDDVWRLSEINKITVR